MKKKLIKNEDKSQINISELDDVLDETQESNEGKEGPKIIDIKFKKGFEERYKKMLRENEYSCFKEFSSRYINKSIRVNTLKISVDEIKKRLENNWELEQVPWCKEGFWIKYKHGKRYDIGNLPEHQLGYIYVQDAASMIPPVVLQPEPGDVVLDMCAAPGSKSSQLAQYMNNEGLLVANDSQGSRLSALGINLQRCGVHNVLITKMEGHRIKLDGAFDKILVDAPCSGTGTIRRNYKIIEMWSPNLVKKMAGIQYHLLSSAFNLLKEGGTIVYSTCTQEPEENELVINRLLENFSEAELSDINININRSEAIIEWEGKKMHESIKKCLRIYPQNNDTEGFFVAKIKKTKRQ